MGTKTKRTLAESFSEIDSIIGKLENADTGLEEAFNLYKEVMKLVKQCNASIDKVEKELIVLEESGEEDE